MELKYVLLTIVKIIISVPTLLLYQSTNTYGVALMGGHLDNKNNTTNITEFYDYDVYDNQEVLNITLQTNITKTNSSNSEEIPNPSPLVLPGYNLPENIFNKGKPFYLEKDPLTGNINFNSKTVSVNDEYEYEDEEPISDDIYDKASIDRKDGNLGSHRPSDVNQLTPNFHDFLNLPVKYNSDKYIYPLISSSYANTKIQGNVNKYQNHKNYNVKTSTVKPTGSPISYYSSTKSTYFSAVPKSTTPMSSSTSTTQRSTTKNLMNSGINHESVHEEYEDYYDTTTKKLKKVHDVFSTTKKNIENIYLTTKAPISTTKRTLSLFEQLFGDYDEIVSTTVKTSSTVPNKVTISEKPALISSTTEYKHYPNSHAGPNILTGSNMGIENNSYDYEDDYSISDDNVGVETNPVKDIKPADIKLPSTTSATVTTTNISKGDGKMDKSTTSFPFTTSPKVTSLPLGENHVKLNNLQPIIVATQNLRDQLNSEKVQPKPFGFNKPPSTSSIHIAPDQDTVSFVVGNHQSVDDGQYVGTSMKESPYENLFRPLNDQQSVSYMEEVANDKKPQIFPEVVSSATIQPQQNSEASLAIGVPVSAVQKVPGQVVDEKLDINENNEYKEGGSKIVFPENEKTSLLPPPQPSPQPNREVLKLSSKPMYHQLPSDLTPPKEKEVPPLRLDRPRPPWDPRPGHFFSGKPEYVRPPRPPQEIHYKRIDNLPNILPQFRPNMKHHYFNRQPLLERISNRPIGFFEKLQPPPPPKNLHNLRKIPPLSQNLEQLKPAEDRIINEAPKKPIKDHFSFYQTPPNVIANRRIDNTKGDVETLQMIQAKQALLNQEPITETNKENSTDKPLYVVYPINTPPIKMDVIEVNKKETVVIGTRAESPLPPSKINGFSYEKNPIFSSKDRNDSPILKPHYRPIELKSDFPYPIEKPDPSILNSALVKSPLGNNLDVSDDLSGSNQWNTVESKIITPNSNQISATLKTYTEKPIAVAYTPTEPHLDPSKYSMPNYGGAVIPEIRQGTVDNVNINSNSEFTVSAVMHTHPKLDEIQSKNDKIHVDASSDFQAPFQASVNVDSVAQGWSVVRDRNKSTTENTEITTLPLATTSEFDIENFKPQLIGGFKPIYDFSEESEAKNAEISEREEK